MTFSRASLLALLTALAPSVLLAQEGGTAAAVQAWVQSAHGDAAAEAFAHWNDEGEVPAACAVCHSGAGFRDFHGLDGTAAGVIDQTIAPGGVVDCDTCHVEGVEAITEITIRSEARRDLDIRDAQVRARAQHDVPPPRQRRQHR